MGRLANWKLRYHDGNVRLSRITPIVHGEIINKGTIWTTQWVKPLSPITVAEAASEKPSLKEAENRISKWFQDQKETEREAMKALVYRILYNEGLRISRAEQVITKSFKV